MMNNSRFLSARLRAWSHLMRLDRPIGTLLLLWPTLWSLWLAGTAVPPSFILMVFIAGVFIMRAAGCVINDYADREIDGHVRRTRHRPLPSGRTSGKEACLLFLFLIIIAFGLVLTQNSFTIALSTIALLLAWIYPFVKRFNHLPQIVLGAAFGWAIPMAWAAVSGSLSITCWLLYLANLCWTVAYDTQYAMVDREDDVNIGVKSTAILFGKLDRLIIGLLQLSTLIIMATIGKRVELGYPFYLSLATVAALFIWQQYLIRQRQPGGCFHAFSNNNIVGLILFIGIALSLPPFSR